MLTILLAFAASAQAAEPPLRGTIRTTFQSTAAPAIDMPTDVAVSADAVYLTDGVNDRVVEFDRQGQVRQFITTVGDQPLRDPIGLAVDLQGRLWIADEGSRRVLVRATDGSLAKALTLPKNDSEKTPDPTDVAITPDGKAAWVVDNENHRLVRFDTATDAMILAGGYGESLGQLHHPFMVAIGPRDDVLVSDVINGRVSVFTALGKPVSPIGSYGIERGQTYRPKGIACDAAGRTWVADSLLGVVQAFAADGSPLDALRDADGKILHFSTPVGLAIDAAGHLFIAELGADRAVEVEVTVGPKPKPPRNAPKPSITGKQSRSCTICHLDWIEPFNSGGSTELASAPPSTPDEPFVSRSDNCISCHDGSVVDSRKRVWVAHGHRTGQTPPAGMTVPQALPLADGKIACRTCHSAHIEGNFNADFRTAVFLRANNRSGELCISCHQDKTRGPQLGTHPIGGMPWPVPQTLVEHGAKVGVNPRQLTCQVCHTPHGSKEDHLLVLGTGSNQLCLTCHDQMRPGMFRDGDHKEHPLNPIANAEQVAAVQTMGTKLSPDGRLVCLSCHKLHHGKGERFMLADDLTQGQFCIRCHSEKTTVVDTLHDLRKSAPQEKNRLGMTPASGGPCSACHMFHRYARAPEASELDPGGGKCITCHQPGRCAGEKTLSTANHPKVKCVECHNPHSEKNAPFLKATPGDLCVSCHAAQAKVTGSPHDRRRGGNAWPEAAAAKQDTCLACHRPHGNDDTGLFRVAMAGGRAAGPDGACIACHAGLAPGAAGNQSLVHPTTDKRLAADSLPRVPCGDAGEMQRIGCRTCHDPHGSPSDAPRFLRVAAGEPTGSVCVQCHTAQRTIAQTGHGMPTDATHKNTKVDACGKCHGVHAEATAATGPKLLSPELRAAVAVAGTTAADAICTTCHKANGAAPPPAIATHPAVAMSNPVPVTATGFLPLFDSHGRESAIGSIGCQTCHVPHGRDVGAPPVQVGDGSSALGASAAGSGSTIVAALASAGTTASDTAGPTAAALAQAERRSRRAMLRSFTAPNACTGCHGFDGLRRFLYFHDAARRSGPLDRETEADVKISGK